MIEFNSSERRAIRGVAVLVALAAAARVSVGPDPGSLAWEGAPADLQLADMRTSVDSALAIELMASRPLAPGEQIDLNAAKVPELRRLPGVGPARAEAIRRERDRRPFGSTADLVRVPGIGQVTAERLAPYLTVGAARGTPFDTIASQDATGGDCARPRLDLNRAGRTDLEALPGIGPSRAEAILEARRRRKFARVHDLERVSGIGPTIAARILAYLCPDDTR